jgi:serine/threonine protein kinase
MAAIGDQLGSYVLREKLGEGAFATVYLGQHVEDETLVAIKVFRVDLADADLERSRAEARLIASLQHPHILRVLDYDEQDNQPYLVMTYAPHGTLRQRHPKDTRVPLAQVVSYVWQIAQALQYAHTHHPPVIHLDLKPENLLLGEQDEVLLGDFGLATVLERSRSSSLFLADVFKGTVLYASPEQFRSRARRASDQYALGVIVYEWLTGSCPFDGQVFAIGAKKQKENPPAMSDAQEVPPDLLPAVQAVVFKALEREPKDRYASVIDFARALAEAAQRPL